jgi:hypothetical protein
LEEISEFAADWLIFESPPPWQRIRAAYKKYCSEKPEEVDALFLEISTLKSQLERLNKTAFVERKMDE